MEIKIRVRGEYSFTSTGLSPIAELPPRARRIPFFTGYWVRPVGTTSACAENTICLPGTIQIHRNYLRVRGEYDGVGFCCPAAEELPPRARRILVAVAGAFVAAGTTSACAENTWIFSKTTAKARNYLRVRGEYPRSIERDYNVTELPPRARRILESAAFAKPDCGTTSACAENTRFFHSGVCILWNYLRVRGEYTIRSR